jgi:hypothetical protein
MSRYCSTGEPDTYQCMICIFIMLCSTTGSIEAPGGSLGGPD